MPVVPPPTSTTTPSRTPRTVFAAVGSSTTAVQSKPAASTTYPWERTSLTGTPGGMVTDAVGSSLVETLLDLGLELADEGDRSGVVEDYAVPHHVGEPGGAGDRPAAVVDGEEHGEGRAQVDPDAEAPRRLDGTGPGHGGVRRVEQLCETGVEPGHQVPPSLTSRSSR